MSSLHTKHRPATFKQVLGQAVAVKALEGALKAKRARAFVLTGPSGCVDGDTEYLSPTGWVRIADYTGGLVAQFHLHGVLSFVQPKEYIKKKCEKFFHLKTKYGVDQALSPEHRVLYITTKGNWGVKSAKEVVDQHRASKHGFSGQFATTFVPNISTRMNLTDAELRLMVAFIADGCLIQKRISKTSSYNYKNKICEECGKTFTPNSGNSLHCPNCRRWWGFIGLKKERKIKRLILLLKEAKVPYVCYEKTSGYKTFYFNPPSRTKTYDEGFWQASLEQLKIISSEVRFWDGTIRGETPNIYTCDKKTADFIQYAITSCGFRTRVLAYHRKGHVEYNVRGSTRQTTSLGKSKISEIRGVDGFKYCFEVPTSYLVLRRNGCIFITGNTGKTTLARIAADYLCGGKANPSNIIEIDAASHTGIDAMREVATKTHYRAVGGADTKIVVVDECHRLSAAAWASLLKIVEEPPPHVYWFFLTTDPGKIPKTIITRCLRLDLKLVSEELILELLIQVADAEKLDVTDEVLEVIAEGAGGSPRQALVFLESCVFCETAADARQIMRSAGQTKEIIDFCRFLVKGRGQNWAEAMKYLNALEGTEAENVRIIVVNYISTALLGAKSEKQAMPLLALLECFAKPYQQSDKFAPLLLSVGMAIGLDQ